MGEEFEIWRNGREKWGLESLPVSFVLFAFVLANCSGIVCRISGSKQMPCKGFLFTVSENIEL